MTTTNMPHAGLSRLPYPGAIAAHLRGGSPPRAGTPRRAAFRRGYALVAPLLTASLLFAVLLGCGEPKDAEPTTPTGSPGAERQEPASAGVPADGPGPGGAAAADRFKPPVTSPPYMEVRISAIGSGRNALVPLYQPDDIVGGLPNGAMVRVYSGAEVVYEHHGDLYVLEADPVLRDGAGEWTYPEDPVANDKRLSTPECEGMMEGFSSPDAIGTFWVDPEGRVAYRCPRQDREPPLHYVDGATVEMGEGLIRALGTESRTLRLGGQWGETWGIDDRGEFSPLELPGSWNGLREPNSILANQDGFLVVFLNDHDDWDRNGPGTLFRIDYYGSVVEAGAYGRPSESIGRSQVFHTLAPSGDLYIVERLREESRVFRFRPDSFEPGEIVYRVAERDPWEIDWVTRWNR